MGLNNRLHTKTPENTQPGKQGTSIGPGPYEGIVKDSTDNTRSGRLKVWIPEMGSGDDEDPDNWVTVSYASPFMGHTIKRGKSKTNSFEQVQQTYGFWAIPPDRGNIVLCIFINGDRNRGYWFACALEKLGHHMIPSIGGGYANEVDPANIKSATVKAAFGEDSVLPLAEFNETDGENVDTDFVQTQKPIHEYQAERYIAQGLDRDDVRGARLSSSQREAPSAVYGWSTPGRPLLNDPAENQDAVKAQIDSGNFNPADLIDAQGRKGGHSFVMDDGEYFGAGQMVRLRSADGNMILMDDSGRSMYMINSDGSVWVEMAGSGHLNIFAARGVNIRATEDLNLHSDANINMNAGGDFNLKAGGGFNVEAADVNTNSAGKTTIYGASIGIGSSGGLAIKAASGAIQSSGTLSIDGASVALNGGGSASVDAPEAIPVATHDDVSFTGGKWTISPGVLHSAVTIAPTHEPWAREAGEFQSARLSKTVPSGGKTNISQSPAPSGKPGDFPTSAECSGNESGDVGPKSAPKPEAKKCAPKSDMVGPKAPNPTGSIGSLTQTQVKALFCQIGFTESNNNYKCINTLNFCGKYQFGAAALVDFGYIKLDMYKKYGQSDRNGQLGTVKHPEAWTGKDGIANLESFLVAAQVQENLMFKLMTQNYNTMVRIGGIKAGDNVCTVMGMLTCAHLLGAGGAKKWRLEGGGADAYGTTGGGYYALGKYAGDVLAAPTNVA